MGGDARSVRSIVGPSVGPISTMILQTQILNLHTQQWHVKFGFNYTSQGLIDPNAVYYAEILAGPRSGLAYKIKGRFPPAIYFSWQVGKAREPVCQSMGSTFFRLSNRSRGG